MSKSASNNNGDAIAFALCGGISGLTSKTALAPLERIKILNQSSASLGFINTLKQVPKQEGFKGYWYVILYLTIL